MTWLRETKLKLTTTQRFERTREGTHRLRLRTVLPGSLVDPSSAAINKDYNPIQLVHSDYTEGYANVIRNRDHPYHQLMTRFMEAENVSSADVESASRILTLQLWRNLGSDLMDYPLAFCDGRSVARDELLSHLVETYGGVPTRFVFSGDGTDYSALPSQVVHLSKNEKR